MFRNVPYGDPTDRNNIMGPLINAAQRERVLAYIEKGKSGGRASRGGRRHAPAVFQGLLR